MCPHFCGVEKFDLILCHAVLEWLDDPKSAVRDLARLVKPGCRMSLMFFNRFAPQANPRR